MGGWLDEVEDKDLADANLDTALQYRGELGVSDDKAYNMARQDYEGTEMLD